jgi:ketosteroid isomerase-like protein
MWCSWRRPAARLRISAPSDIVTRLFAAFATRDAEALVALLAEDSVFEPASTEVAIRSPYHGREGMRAYLAEVERDWEQFDVSIAELREAPPYVIALGRVYARSGGFVADNPIAFVWEVRDGLIVWGRTFTDRAAALRFAGVS